MRRPRLTGRFAVLLVVLAVLMVSYASSLRAYLEQRDHIAGLRADIASAQANIGALRREKQRWDDPEYLKQQAGERFGWVMPGVVGFRVLGRDGEPLDHADTLSPPPPETVDDGLPLWWEATLTSIEVAGVPDSPAARGPAARIVPPRSQQP